MANPNKLNTDSSYTPSHFVPSNHSLMILVLSTSMVMWLLICTLRSKYSWQSLALFLLPQHALNCRSCFWLIKCSDFDTIHFTPSLYGGVVSDPSYWNISILTTAFPRRLDFLTLRLEASNRWSNEMSFFNGISAHFLAGNWLQNCFKKSLPSMMPFANTVVSSQSSSSSTPAIPRSSLNSNVVLWYLAFTEKIYPPM